jgi:signal transduction histidine kinase
MNTACLVLLDGAHDSLDAVSAAVRQAGAQIDVSLANSPQVLESILERHAPVGVVTRARVWGQDVFEFLEPYGPQVAGIVALPSPDGAQVADALLNHHAIDIADPAQPMRFASAVRRLTSAIHGAQAEAKNAGLERLVDVVQELSRARTLDGVMAVVRRAARKLTGAQGACFVLREGDICYYADEDAISPLWKGQRFPADTCISGISMMSGEPVVIEDIFNDDRVPLPAYAPTFVRSLVMVPIRPGSPVGAIGTYWAWPRLPAHGEVELLQTLANATSLAIENAMTQQNLERLVAERTRELQATNEELDAFSASVSHDLRNRLNAAYGFCTLLELRATPVLDETSRGQLSIVKDAITQMTHTTGDLLTMARSGRQSLVREDVDLSELAARVVQDLRHSGHHADATVNIEPGMRAWGDRGLLHIALDNLVSNALKYSSKASTPVVEIGVGMAGTADTDEPSTVFFVRDNGVGFDDAAASRLFHPFVRLHDALDYPGTGLGLTIVRRVLERHGGSVRAVSSPGRGTTFFFTLPGKPQAN